MLDDILGAAHHHGGDAGCFERARSQADALVADRTVGHQHRSVDAVGPAPREQLRPIGLQRSALAAVGGQAVKARGQRTDAPAADAAAQRCQREVAADVLGGGVRTVDRHVRNAQVGVARGIARVHTVELGRRVVRCAGALVAALGAVRRRGGHHRHAALRQRLGQTMERHLDAVRPPVRLAVAERLVVVACAPHVAHRHIVGRGAIGLGR
jgi:hypothetical protein